MYGMCRCHTGVIVECAEKEKLLLEVVEMLKAVLCTECNERFPDNVSCQAHQRVHSRERESNTNNTDSRNLHPKTMKVSDLKKELQSRKLSTTGNKEILIRRLEGALTKEVN